MKILRNGTLYILGLGIPLFFLPNIFADAFGVPKLLLLILGVCVLLLVWAATVFRTNTLHWRATPFDIPLAALAGAYLLSTFIASPQKIAALTSPGGSGVVLLLVLLYFLIVQTDSLTTSADVKTPGDLLPDAPSVSGTGRETPGVKRPTLSEPALMGLVHSAVLISLWTVINVGLELAKFQYQLAVFQFPLANLSPLGSLLTQAVFLAIVLVYLGSKIMRRRTNLGLAISLVLVLGLLTTSYQLQAAPPFPLLPYSFGWTIALDSFKNAPMFGVGPDNFISAFTRFKPAEINMTQYWNVTFGMSSNWYFHILTTVGALGLAAYLWLVYRSYRTYKYNRTPKRGDGVALTFLAILALQAFVPFNLPLLFVAFVFLTAFGIAQAGQPSAIRLVTIREGLVEVDTGEEKIVESWEEVEVEENKH